MTQSVLLEQIKSKKSFLCVGLDVDQDRMPLDLKDDPDSIFTFCKRIIEATAPYCVAYKPNIAFFEACGSDGWKSLQKVMDFLNKNYPEIFTIADAKRADIGNTSVHYAKAYFKHFEFDSVTIAPYMGKDSVEPFLSYEKKHTILLALTSNEGASDFQLLNTEGKPLYEKVIEQSKKWKNADRLMYVVGATKAQSLQKIRSNGNISENNSFGRPPPGSVDERGEGKSLCLIPCWGVLRTTQTPLKKKIHERLNF